MLGIIYISRHFAYSFSFIQIKKIREKSTSVDIFFIVSTHSVHMIIIISTQVDIPLTVSTFSIIVASSNLP